MADSTSEQGAVMANRSAEFINDVAASLGLETRKVQRLVIDADVRAGVVKVYVTAIPEPGVGVPTAFALAGKEAIVFADTDAETDIEERLLASQKRLLDAIEKGCRRTNGAI